MCTVIPQAVGSINLSTFFGNFMRQLKKFSFYCLRILLIFALTTQCIYLVSSFNIYATQRYPFPITLLSNTCCCNKVKDYRHFNAFHYAILSLAFKLCTKIRRKLVWRWLHTTHIHTCIHTSTYRNEIQCQTCAQRTRNATKGNRTKVVLITALTFRILGQLCVGVVMVAS